MSLAGIEKLGYLPPPPPLQHATCICDGTGMVKVGHYLRPEAQGDFGWRQCALCKVKPEVAFTTEPTGGQNNEAYLALVEYLLRNAPEEHESSN